MGGGFGVDPAMLARSAQGIRGVVDTLGEVGHGYLAAVRPLTWHFAWDALDRLVGATTPDGTRWRYRYDALGRRVAKERLGAGGEVVEQVLAAWDGTVLVEETRLVDGAESATAWEWEPGTYRPVAQVTRTMSDDEVDERFRAIVTDLVGPPTELADTAGEVVGAARTSLWARTGPRALTPPPQLRPEPHGGDRPAGVADVRAPPTARGDVGDRRLRAEADENRRTTRPRSDREAARARTRRTLGRQGRPGPAPQRFPLDHAGDHGLCAWTSRSEGHAGRTAMGRGGRQQRSRRSLGARGGSGEDVGPSLPAQGDAAVTGVQLAIERGGELPGALHYLRDEYSFDFFPDDDEVFALRGVSTRTSLLVQDLQLEIGLPGQEVLYAWGLHPYTTWNEGALEVPVAEPGIVRILEPDDLIPGSSVALDGRDEWTTTWDPDRRWARVCSPDGDGGAAVEVATGVVLRIVSGNLRSVWLHPAVIED